MPSYTTDTLLDTIKRKAFIPSIQSTFTDEDLLALATEEMHNTLLPAILNTREEFFVVKDSVTIAPSVSDMYYEIPYRAIGMSLRDVTVTDGTSERKIPRYELEDKSWQDANGSLYGFYLKNNNVHLLGSMSGSLNFYYYLRPGDLVKTELAATIVSTDTTLNTITVDQVPSAWAVGTILDVVNDKPGFDTKMISNPVVDITGTVITFQDPLPTKPDGTLVLAAGQWVTEEGYSPVPQIPIEFFQYLAEAVTAYVMESQGDQDGYVRAQQRMIRMLESAQKTISPRVDGTSKKFVPRRNKGVIFYGW